MREILQQWFTGADNKTHDIGRALWAFIAVSHVSVACWHIYRGLPVDLQGFGTGAAAILGAGGAALGFKAKTEPEAQQ